MNVHTSQKDAVALCHTVGRRLPTGVRDDGDLEDKDRFLRHMDGGVESSKCTKKGIMWTGLKVTSGQGFIC